MANRIVDAGVAHSSGPRTSVVPLPQRTVYCVVICPGHCGPLPSGMSGYGNLGTRRPFLLSLRTYLPDTSSIKYIKLSPHRSASEMCRISLRGLYPPVRSSQASNL